MAKLSRKEKVLSKKIRNSLIEEIENLCDQWHDHWCDIAQDGIEYEIKILVGRLREVEHRQRKE